jgi:hypothetical protein
MLNEIVNEFLGSNTGNQVVKSITSQHGIDATQAQNAIRATAEGGAQAMKSKGLDFANVVKGFGGIGGAGAGGPANDVVKNVTDYVCQKTGLSRAIGGAIVGMVLPKLLEYAKGRGAPV